MSAETSPLDLSPLRNAVARLREGLAMNRMIDLPEADDAIVRMILRTSLPAGVHVWAFGSRVSGAARRYSDLDLALRAEGPLPSDVLAELREALSESDLTIKVDVVDLHQADQAFRRLIEPRMVPLLTT